MTPLEIKKLQVEYHKVFAGRLDLEMRIDEMMETVKKYQDSVEAASRREQEIQEKLAEVQK
jgi:predicted  nucleic acid-binding Zn-ribbon protein